MATIGLRDLYRAPITVGEGGEETYGTPVRMAKAISAEMSVEVAEAILYADDGADEVVKEFVSGELTLNVNDLMPACGHFGADAGRRSGCICGRKRRSPVYGNRLSRKESERHV